MSCLLAKTLLNPQTIVDMTPTHYNQLIPQARSTNLLGSLFYVIEKADLLDQIPPDVHRHLESAAITHAKQRQDLDYEIQWLKKAYAETDDKLVLLKGAAYLQADLPNAAGRMLSDIDLLAPAHRIVQVEKALNRHGWHSAEMDPYNERYYRQWMHEIPPLGHKARRSTLDLHHTILPPTAAPNVNANLLHEETVEVRPGVFTLSARDMVIHSATHLFHEGEFRHGLRDLWDLDRMLRDFPTKDRDFWANLVPRARELDLTGALFHSLNYTQRVFETPVPEAVMTDISTLGTSLRKPMMDFLFDRAFLPDQPECRKALHSAALTALYIRSHYLRMPVYLLVPHLIRKSWMKHFSTPETDTEPKPAA
tara:strand:+ start:4101 stop:5198 length:1098 start_codon:yes stop_codon:yes gene_type:complete